MESLLQIASKVEAAVASYMSVRPVTDADLEEWWRQLDQERVRKVFQLSLAMVSSPFELVQCSA